MSCAEIHLDDIGTRFTVTIMDDDEVVDLSSYTTKQIILSKPSGEKLTKTATFLTDGTDGVIYYDSISGDLDEVGLWRIQAILDTFHSNISTFKVYRNL